MRFNAEKTDTRREMGRGLKEMLKEGAEKITVSSLAEYCQIHRNTFYYHFSEIEELTEWIIADDLKETDPCEYVNQERDFLKYAYKLLGYELFTACFREGLNLRDELTKDLICAITVLAVRYPQRYTPEKVEELLNGKEG